MEKILKSKVLKKIKFYKKYQIERFSLKNNNGKKILSHQYKGICKSLNRFRMKNCPYNQ